MKKQSQKTPTKPELAKCATCGNEAIVGKCGKSNRLVLVQCKSEDPAHGSVTVIGTNRAFKIWNALQKKNASHAAVTPKATRKTKKTFPVVSGNFVEKLEAPKTSNKSGAKSSAFGKGTSAVEKDFAKNAKPVKKQTDMEIEWADDRKVKIPDWVEVIDSKFGCIIGYQPRQKVFDLLQSDCRFRENVTQENVIQLFYNGEWAKNNFIEVSCNALDEYARLVQRNLDTVTACDDPLGLTLQCSYEAQGRHFVANISLEKIKDYLPLIDRKLRKLIAKRKTNGIIEFFQKKLGR